MYIYIYGKRLATGRPAVTAGPRRAAGRPSAAS